MTTYVKRGSTNCPIHYLFLSHLQYNTLWLSPSRVFYNEWHSWYSNLDVINDSTGFVTQVHFKAKSCSFETGFFHNSQSIVLISPKTFCYPCLQFQVHKNVNQKFNYIQSQKITRIRNLLSKNRLIHLKPIMTFLGKLFETYPKIRPIKQIYNSRIIIEMSQIFPLNTQILERLNSFN